jgi:hypothetical protein
MKIQISGLLAAAALFGAAQAQDAVSYDLWLATDAAQAMIAVSGEAKGAPFAVAKGEAPSALDILADDEASLVIADLRAKAENAASAAEDAMDASANEQTTATADEKAEADADGVVKARKIILVKKAGEEADAKATRRIIKLKTDESMDAEAINAEIEKAKTEVADVAADAADEEEIIAIEGEDAALLALAGDAKTTIFETEEDGAHQRLVHVSGANADAARGFIDDAKGLDDAEKAAMKSKLGL